MSKPQYEVHLFDFNNAEIFNKFKKYCKEPRIANQTYDKGVIFIIPVVSTGNHLLIYGAGRSSDFDDLDYNAFIESLCWRYLATCSPDKLSKETLAMKRVGVYVPYMFGA